MVVHDHEIRSAERLADVGLRVRFRELVNGQHVKNIDVTIDSELWEIKSPQGAGKSTISNQLHRAKEQGAHRVVIDNSRTPLDDTAVLDELRRRFAAFPWFVGLIHIARDGTVTRLTR
jgi:ABC-type lipoprotein export system ATPase subunit